MLTVLTDFATAFRRYAAGDEVAPDTIPGPERDALIAAGYLAPAPLPAVAPADPVTD